MTINSYVQDFIILLSVLKIHLLFKPVNNTIEVDPIVQIH